MKSLASVVAVAILGVCTSAAASAQPILNRVEKFLREQVEAIQNAPPAEPGYLGLTGDDVEGQGGVRVVAVVPGHAAEKAGLHPGDVITGIAERVIRSLDDLATALNGRPPGATLAVLATRDGQPRQFEVTLGARQPAAAPTPGVPPGEEIPPATPLRLGLRTVPVTDAVRKLHNLPDTRGAHVISVAVDSPAKAAGIPLGAVIRVVDNRVIDGPQDLAAAVGESGGGDLELIYFEGGQSVRKMISLPLAAAPPSEPLPPASPAATAPGPPRQVVARQPLPEFPGPGEIKPPVIENPGLERDERIEALERRIQQLEQRLAEMEAALTAPAAAPGGEN